MATAEERIVAILEASETRLRRRLDQILADLRSRLSEDQLRIAVAAGGGAVERLVAAESEVAARQLAQEVNAAYLAAAAAAAEFASTRVEATAVFDATNVWAVQRMRANTLRLVREFTEEQRSVVRAALTRTVAAGVNPRAAARVIRGDVGLTVRQQQIVDNYRRQLERGDAGALSRALRDGRYDRTVRAVVEGRRGPLSLEQIDAMVEAYRRRWLKYRSEVISRTEALRATHQGTQDLYRQMIEAGQMRPEWLRRRWITARDHRVRHSHSAMHGQEQPWGVPFVSGAGHLLMHPGDSGAPAKETMQCRCVETIRVYPTF